MKAGGAVTFIRLPLHRLPVSRKRFRYALLRCCITAPMGRVPTRKRYLLQQVLRPAPIFQCASFTG
nr:MAG TPA: hypothetical protein [Caudoviricetes sp.]